MELLVSVSPNKSANKSTLNIPSYKLNHFENVNKVYNKNLQNIFKRSKFAKKKPFFFISENKLRYTFVQ